MKSNKKLFLLTGEIKGEDFIPGDIKEVEGRNFSTTQSMSWRYEVAENEEKALNSFGYTRDKYGIIVSRR